MGKKLTPEEKIERAKKRKIAAAVETVFGALSSDGSGAFESLCLDEGLLLRCPNCELNCPVTDEKCDECGSALDADEEDDDGEEIAYRYLHAPGIPVVQCPDCGGHLTDADAVNIQLAVSGQNVDVKSRLDTDGRLIDTDDHAVAKGFHSETSCARCGESLTPYEEQI